MNVVFPYILICARPKTKSNTAENNCRNRPEEADDVQGERQLCLEDKQMHNNVGVTVWGTMGNKTFNK